VPPFPPSSLPPSTQSAVKGSSFSLLDGGAQAELEIVASFLLAFNDLYDPVVCGVDRGGASSLIDIRLSLFNNFFFDRDNRLS